MNLRSSSPLRFSKQSRLCLFNVQRRLGELFKRKQVKRENGRYGVA